MSSKEWLKKFIDELDEEEASELTEILDLMEMDPGILYHELSKYSIRWRVIKRKWSRAPRPSLLKEIKGEIIALPKPRDIRVSLGETLKERHSVRDYRSIPISLEELSTLLYYSAGIKGYEWGYPKRMFPSAGGLQPIEVYIYANMVDGLKKGIYHYQPRNHILVLYKEGDYSLDLYRASLDQEHVYKAQATLLISLVYSRTFSKYSHRAYRYVNLDLGHIGQNVYLVATALGMGTCATGAFDDDSINELLDLDGRDEFIAMMYPVGKI